MHRAKRQFRPSITSFFARADRDDYGFDASLSFGEPQFLAPTLPSAVQASLLNVGMRVRKSVPEGYKTHKALPPTDSISLDPFSHHHQQPAVPSKPLELLPYCGLHKTGGLTPTARLLPSAISPSDDVATAAVPAQASAAPIFNFSVFASSSQDSKTSSLSAASTIPTKPPPLNTRKRSYEDAAVDDDLISPFQLDGPSAHLPLPMLATVTVTHHLAVQKWDDDEPVSPRTVYPVSHTAMPDLSSLRPLARPKTRRKRSGGKGADAGGEIRGGGDGGLGLDFGEAEFLRLDDEVEMGGM